MKLREDTNRIEVDGYGCFIGAFLLGAAMIAGSIVYAAWATMPSAPGRPPITREGP